MQRHQRGYSGLQILLHWILAVLVLFQLIFGESMTAVVDAAEDGLQASGADLALGSAHYWIGIAILVFVGLRILLRLTSGVPRPADSGPAWMSAAARASHILFYILLAATPILGLLAYYVGDPFGEIHSLAKPVFILLIVLHAAAALLHHFWLKDDTLKRIFIPGV